MRKEDSTLQKELVSYRKEEMMGSHKKTENSLEAAFLSHTTIQIWDQTIFLL